MAKTEVKTETEVRDEITGAGVEKAVIDFFEGINLTLTGEYSIGNKQININRDKEEQVLRVTATVDGVVRAVIHSYYGSVFAAYFRLQGDEDAQGIRDDVVFNRGTYGKESIDLFRGPGVDLRQKKLAQTQTERLEIAERLGIPLNVPPSQKTRILK